MHVTSHHIERTVIALERIGTGLLRIADVLRDLEPAARRSLADDVRAGRHDQPHP